MRCQLTVVPRLVDMVVWPTRLEEWLKLNSGRLKGSTNSGTCPLQISFFKTSILVFEEVSFELGGAFMVVVGTCFTCLLIVA